MGTTKGEPITTKFTVDISELKAGIQEANRQIRLANSEFKAASSGMDDWANSTDGLQAKIKQLTTVQDSENKKLELLKQQYELIAEEQGENSAAAQNLMVKINNQQAAVNKTTSELGKYKQQLNDINSASNAAAHAVEDQRSAYDKLEDTIRLANSEFKAASSGMDDWKNSTDGLQAKIKQLTTVQDSENKKLELLKQQYELIAEEQGENSAAAQNLMVKINNQQAAVNKTTSELGKYKQQLNDINSASNAAAEAVDEQKSTYDKLQDTIDAQKASLSSLRDQYIKTILEYGNNSYEAITLRSEMKALNDELSDNKSKLNDASSEAKKLSSALGDVNDSANESGGGFTILKGALAEFAGNVITSAANGIRDFVGSLFELSEATKEYRSMNAKISGSADAFGYSVDFANEKYKQFYKYLSDDQMATNAITNLLGMKVSTDTVSDAANAAIAVWSAYGDSIPIERLTESINESAQVAQVTGSLADTINWAARSNEEWTAAMQGHSAAQDAFNKAISEGESQEDAYSAALAACSSTQERADLIAQTLNQTYGESKETYDEMSSSILDANEAELELKDSQAKLGRAIEPVNTAITELKTKALDAIIPSIEKVAQKFNDFLSWMIETPGAASTTASIVAGLATAFGILATALAIQVLISGVQKAFALLNATMLANPVVLIAALIAGLVVAFITLWNTSDDFRNFWIGLWDGIKSTCSTAISAIADFFTKTLPNAFNTVLDFIKNNWQELLLLIVNPFAGAFALAYKHLDGFRSFIDNFVSTIKNSFVNTWNAIVSFFTQSIPNFIQSVINSIQELPSRIWGILTDIIGKVTSWGSSMVSKGAQAASDLSNSIINGITSLPNRVASIGSDIVRGIWSGITSMGDWISSKISGFASGIVSGFKKALGIKSPSRVFKAEAKWIPAGIGEGVGDNQQLALNPINKLTDKIRKGAKNLKGALIPQGLDTLLSQKVSAIKNQVSGATKSMVETTQQVKNITFNQYNNSPKALSRLDIYRQTNNQLFSAKRSLSNV